MAEGGEYSSEVILVRILQLISSGGFYGAENVVVQLGLELSVNPNYEMVFGLIENHSAPHREFFDVCQKCGLHSIIFSSQHKIDLLTISSIKNYVKNNHVNLVHSHGYKANMYARLSTIGLPVFLVATCHNWIGNNLKEVLYKFIDQFFLYFFNHIAVVSSSVQKKMLNIDRLHRKTTVVNNGVMVDQKNKNSLKTVIRNCLNINMKSIIIGIVGRISIEKGHEHLLKVFLRISQKNSNIVLLVVGDGYLREQLEKKYSREDIVFTGARYDLRGLYKCMDIFVLPSLQEGMPMVLLEAMAAGLPVVASRVGEVENVVIDQQTGLLVSAADEAGLETALQFLINNPKKRKMMGRLGHSRVCNHYSVGHMAGKYVAIYRMAMQRER